MTPADLRLYGWLLARPSTPAGIVAELSGTAEERTLQRVHEDLRALVEAGKITHEAGGLVWCEAGGARSVVERIADLLRIGPLRLGEIARAIGAPFAEVKTALVCGAFRERSMKWHLTDAPASLPAGPRAPWATLPTVHPAPPLDVALRLWLSERCATSGRERSSNLYADFCRWAESIGAQWTQREFGIKLSGMFDSKKSNGYIVYVGVSLNALTGME